MLIYLRYICFLKFLNEKENVFFLKKEGIIP